MLVSLSALALTSFASVCIHVKPTWVFLISITRTREEKALSIVILFPSNFDVGVLLVATILPRERSSNA